MLSALLPGDTSMPFSWINRESYINVSVIITLENIYIEPIEHIYQHSLRCDKFTGIPSSKNPAV